MKKFFLMLAVALPMFLMASCGDDNDDVTISLDKTALNLEYSKTAELTASEKNGTWASSNEFVASVDQKGKVTANHAGKATITVSKAGASASCVVTVTATNTYFSTITTWGINPAQVLAQLPTSVDPTPVDTYTNEEDDVYGVVYSGLGLAYPWYGFYFKDNATSLSASQIIFTDKEEETNDLQGYLDQHFQKVANYDNEFGEGVMYLDNTSYSLASLSALISINDNGDWEILYRPVVKTKAGEMIDNSVLNAAKILKASVKAKK